MPARTSPATLERDTRPVSEADAEAYVASTCFKTGPPGRVGVEVERIVHDVHDPCLPVPAARVRAAVPAGPLPGGGLVTTEPGGQVELSTACAPDLPRLLTAARVDLGVLEAHLADAGLVPSPAALDLHRPPVRTLRSPRYAAMERHFDAAGPHGRTMMCSTAAHQVCLDAGTDGPGAAGAAARWRLLHHLLPVLVAVFANSPTTDGAGRRWRSGRQRCWLGIDPARTAAPGATPHASADPRADWARYALDAPLLCLPAAGRAWDAPAGLTMRAWLRGGGPRPATTADLDYHLTTLFPPVRPRGFLEVRALDAQAGADWVVATVVTAALVEDERAGDAAAAACEPVAATGDAALRAARDGLTDAVLARAARAVAEAARDGARRLGLDDATLAAVEAFLDRYPLRGRSPADDRTPAPHPAPRSTTRPSGEETP